MTKDFSANQKHKRTSVLVAIIIFSIASLQLSAALADGGGQDKGGSKPKMTVRIGHVTTKNDPADKGSGTRPKDGGHH